MKKNKLILLQVFIVFILICTSVYAADTAISLKASSTDVKAGEEVEIILSLQDVDSTKKVTNIEGYINYNKNIFETVTADNIEHTVNQSNNKKVVTIGDEKLPLEDLTNKREVSASDAYVAFNGTPDSNNDIKIIIDFDKGVTSNVELLKIKFKVKDGVSLGTVVNAIKYEVFEITAGGQTRTVESKNVNITVVAAKDSTEKPENKAEEPANKVEEPKNTNTNTNTNKATNTNTNTNTNKTTNTNTNTNKTTNTNTNNKNLTGNTNSADNTVAGTNLPATGAKVIVIPAIVLIVLAYVSYNKYMKYKNI